MVDLEGHGPGERLHTWLLCWKLDDWRGPGAEGNDRHDLSRKSSHGKVLSRGKRCDQHRFGAAHVMRFPVSADVLHQLAANYVLML